MRNLKKLKRSSAILHVLSVIFIVLTVLTLVVNIAGGVVMMVQGDAVKLTLTTANEVTFEMEGIGDTDYGDLKVDEMMTFTNEEGNILASIALQKGKLLFGFNMTPTNEIGIINGKQIGAALLVSAASLLFVLLFAIQFARVFRNLRKCITPFSPELVSRLHGFAWLTFFYTIVSFAQKVASAVIFGTSLKEYFGNITNVLQTAVPMVVVMLVVMAAINVFARIVRYGTEEVENFN